MCGSMTRRIEITVSEETWDALNAARGHEPRASFVKRALESALGLPSQGGAPGSGGESRGPGVSTPAPSRAPVPQREPHARSKPVPGVVPARTLTRDTTAMERQARLNKAKGS